MSEDYAAPFLDALRAFIEVLEANPRDDDRIVAARKVLIDATSRFYHHVPVERINEVEKFYKFNSVAVHNYVTPHYLVPPQLLPVPTIILRRLREFYEDLGGKAAGDSRGRKGPRRPAILITAEDELILSTLADAYPAAVTQPDLERLANITRQRISDRLKWLEARPRRFVARPDGTKRKGHAITPAGLSAIGRPVEAPH